MGRVLGFWAKNWRIGRSHSQVRFYPLGLCKIGLHKQAHPFSDRKIKIRSSESNRIINGLTRLRPTAMYNNLNLTLTSSKKCPQWDCVPKRAITSAWNRFWFTYEYIVFIQTPSITCRSLQLWVSTKSSISPRVKCLAPKRRTCRYYIICWLIKEYPGGRGNHRPISVMRGIHPTHARSRRSQRLTHRADQFMF